MLVHKEHRVIRELASPVLRGLQGLMEHKAARAMLGFKAAPDHRVLKVLLLLVHKAFKVLLVPQVLKVAKVLVSQEHKEHKEIRE
jgi:hypothetical protein